MQRSQAGFTAIELAVVSVVLLALAAAAFPIYLRYIDDAAVSQVKADCEVIANAVRLYRHDTDQWPQDQPLGVDPGLVTNVSGLTTWRGPYLVNFSTGPKKMIRTAGVNTGSYEYDYDSVNSRARVTCWGLNKTFDGADPGYWNTYTSQGDDIIVYLNRP